MNKKALLTIAGMSLLAVTSCETHNYYKNENQAAKPAAKPVSQPVVKPVVVAQKTEQQKKLDTIAHAKQQGLITEEAANKMVMQVLGLQASTPLTAPAPVKASVQQEAANMDLNLNKYQAKMQLSNKLTSIGSDSMDRMMEMWEVEFKKHHPRLNFSHEGKGSSTAIPALLEGTSNVGPMSRKFKDSEIAKFNARFGYKPIQLRVAVDAMGVFIHPENPLAQTGITLAQLDAIFSSDCKRGAKSITRWGQLGLKGEWANAPIKVYSRNTASGTYGFFKKKVLLKGAFKSTNMELDGSEQVVSSVAADKFSIGFSGIAYNTPEVSTMPLAENTGSDFFSPSEINALSGDYSLTRSLFIALNIKPGTQPTALQKEFINFVYSRTGQSIVRKDGYYPVNAVVAKQEQGKMVR